MDHASPARAGWIFAAILALAAAGTARGSCGSATCPIDPQSLNLPGAGRFTLDFSWQYIDQDQAYRGRNRIPLSSIPFTGDEIEKRTVNRLGSLSLNYGATRDLLFTVTLPWADRYHEHLAGEGEGSSPATERWRLDGLGDAVVGLRYRFLGRLWGGLALKLPTGSRSARNDAGIDAEPTIAPGTGSTDVTASLTWQESRLVPSLTHNMMGNTAVMPWFLGVSARRNGRGTEDYRVGDELQINAGAAYPVLEQLQLLLQINARFKGEDDVGRTDAVRDHTGGSFVYASPGLRVPITFEIAAYAYVQIPIYQRVNGVNLVSRYNLLGGLQVRL